MSVGAIIAAQEQRWYKRLLQSPRGSLLLHNSFFEELQRKNAVYMLHITTALEPITKQGKLYPSGGCLIGGVYGVPLFPGPEGLRSHNLGSYISKQETPRCLAAKSLHDRTVDMLVIKLDTSTLPYTEPIGIDYLHMGDIHLKTYQSLTKNLLPDTRKQIESSVAARIAAAWPFLQLCGAASQEDKQIDTEQFFALLSQAVDSLPILGYIYFEALSEYLMLFSQDKRSQRYMAMGELNCWGYKECIFRLRPNLLRNFSLATFNPSIAELRYTLGSLESEGHTMVQFAALLEYVKQRVILLINSCLFGPDAGPPQPTVMPQFDTLAALAPPLVGHTVDREVRRTDRYKGFHFLFDEHKAMSIWSYWNAMGVVTPFNGLLPKGEMGINPASAHLTYEVYRGRPRWLGSDLYVEPAEELAITISPQLIHPRHSFMGIGEHL